MTKPRLVEQFCRYVSFGIIAVESLFDQNRLQTKVANEHKYIYIYIYGRFKKQWHE